MQMKHRFVPVAVAAVIGFGGALPAHAQDNFGGYIGASFGESDPSANGFDSSSSQRIYGGYMFSPMWGLEAGFSDLGNFDASGGGSVEVTGGYLAGVGSYPVGANFSVFGKLGAYHYEFDSGAVNEDGTSAMLGLGVNYFLTPNFALGAEFSMVNDVEDEDIDTIWFNAVFDMDGQ